MRRVVQTLSLAVMSLVLLVLPAAAAGEEAPKPPAEGFGSGMWDGLMLAAVFGVIVGLVVFLDAASRDDGTDAHAADEGHH